MTEREHTTAKLARAMEAIPGVPAAMIQKARDGYYHDFMSPLDFPEITLVKDLRELAELPATPRDSRPLLMALAQAVIDGEHDASKEESDAWMASPEGQATFAELTGAGRPTVTPALDGTAAADDVKACADLVGRCGGKSFECGFLHDDVPAEEAGWFATATFKGTKISAENKRSPAGACRELAVTLLTGSQCQHCRKLVTLDPAGAIAHDVTLINGQRWTKEEQAKAGLCHWRRAGDRWVRGCE